MENCNTGIVIPTTEEPCSGNYISTNCTAIPNNITYLNLSAGDSQSKVNAAIVTALTFKDEQIAQIPVVDGSETKIIAGANVNVTGLGTTVSPYIVTALHKSVPKVYSARINLNSMGGASITAVVIKNDFQGIIAFSDTVVGADGKGGFFINNSLPEFIENKTEFSISVASPRNVGTAIGAISSIKSYVEYIFLKDQAEPPVAYMTFGVELNIKITVYS